METLLLAPSEEQSTVRESIEIVRESAKQMYVHAKTPRFDRIAERCNVSIAQIKQWKDLDGWLDARQKNREQKLDKRKIVHDENLEAMHDVLTSSKNILAMVRTQVSFNRRGYRKVTQDPMNLADVITAWKSVADSVLKFEAMFSKESA